MSKLSRISGELNDLADNWLKVNGTRKSEVVNELYLLLHTTLQNDYHKIARSIDYGVHETDVEAAYADAFMNCLERYQGGNFTNLLSSSFKNKRADLSKINRRRNNRFQMEKSDTIDDKKTVLSYLEYAHAQKTLGYSLDYEVIDRPINDETRRAIIDYLLEQVNDETTRRIIDEWLDDGVSENNILKITQKLGINYSTAWRKIKKLEKFYDNGAIEEFGYIDKYLAYHN